MRSKNKKSVGKKFIIILFCIILIPVVIVFVMRFEGEKPLVNLDLHSEFIGRHLTIPLKISDKKSGLRKVNVYINKDGVDKILLEKRFPAVDFIRGGKIKETELSIDIEPLKLNLSDGKAILRIVVTDYSWRKWFQGNRFYMEQQFVIDTKPPYVSVLTRQHNISMGGSGLAIYKITEEIEKSGVLVGGRFFPGYSGYFKNKDIYMAFFALNFDQNNKTKIIIQAFDKAGNVAKCGLYHYIKKKRFKKDVINISDRFLEWKMPEFNIDNMDESNIPIDKFISVNTMLRKKNGALILAQGAKTAKKIFWEGSFLRLPNSATRATFADSRSYKYRGRVIDKQVHLGIDLASVAHSTVVAANKGVVVFGDNVGIYGKTVVLDHGFGVLSTYSHLSQIDVVAGQVLSKGEGIGQTGITGLAGGDHLHFGMIIHNTFVNPIEWWDKKWIKNNITTKIEMVKERE